MQPLTPLITMFEALRRSAPAGGIDAHAVQKALGLRSLYLAERLLVALSGERPFRTAQEFIAAAQETMAGSAEHKLEFLFRLHDADGDGLIHAQEFERMFHISAAEHDLVLTEVEIDRLVHAVMDAGDRDRDGKINVFEFVKMVTSQPEMLRRLSDYGVSLLMPGSRARRRQQLPTSGWRGWVRNEVLSTLWIFGYWAINIVLFTWAMLRYQAAGEHLYVQIARGFGACLNFNAALIAVPMLRLTLTRIRQSFLGELVPVDDSVRLHALLGEMTVLFGVAHSVAHVLNLLHAGIDPLLPAYVTGWALLAAMALIWIGSREAVRRSQRFELFHVSHLMYFAVVALLFLHGPRFWIWGTVPWTWFLIERAMRAQRRRGRSQVVETKLHSAGVTRVEFSRPDNFDYKPGDYVFLRLPVIARHEWHPFTLTSAPENRERLSVHIRTLGDWTSALRERVPQLVSAGEHPAVHIDGPYGTASRHILDVPHAVAIAGGIGVTPFASILQSLLLRQNDRALPRPALQKLHFVWLNRDQHAFQWFRELLAQLEKADTRKVLEIHTFMTKGRAEMNGGIMDFARYVLSSRAHGDLITGLRSQTNLGAPDFDRLLEGFYRDPGVPPPEVFFCGPVPLERIVAKSCRRLGLRFRCERF